MTDSNYKSQPKSVKKQVRQYDLDFLRVCAIIAVIIVHCIALSTNPAFQTSNPRSWFSAIAIDSFIRWCVPVFVMISGAFAINSDSYKYPRVFFKKRFLRLLPALIIWPVIYEVWMAIVLHHSIDWVALIRGYALGSPIAGSQLYFVFLIAGLYLFTPFISAYVHLATRKQLWVTTISIMTATTSWYTISTLVWGYEPTLNLITQGLPYIGYFLLGYLMKDVYVKNWLIPVAVFILGGIAIDITLTFTQRTFLYNFFFAYPTVLVMIVSPAAFLSGRLLYKKITSLLRAERLVKLNRGIVLLSGSAFGVYLTHLIVLDILSRTLNLNKAFFVDSIILIPCVIIASWSLTLVLLRVPYLRNLVK